MLNIGCHLSVSKGFEAMGLQALEIGANTFQFFTRNPRGSKAKDLDLRDINTLLELVSEKSFSKLLAHAPYTLNPCSDKSHTREFASLVISDDLDRMQNLPGNLYNFHPGNHVGQGVEKGIDYIANLLNSVLSPKHQTTVLLETMSGKGTEIGSNFSELKEILDRVHLSEKMGVCLDTCHVYDAGYDIVNDLDGVLEEFDSIIGLERLKAIHLNDSKNPFGSHKDRHETIGQGHIGLPALVSIINHPDLRDLPFLLETPNQVEGHKREIELLKSHYKNLKE